MGIRWWKEMKSGVRDIICDRPGIVRREVYRQKQRGIHPLASMECCAETNLSIFPTRIKVLLLIQRQPGSAPPMASQAVDYSGTKALQNHVN